MRNENEVLTRANEIRVRTKSLHGQIEITKKKKGRETKTPFLDNQIRMKNIELSILAWVLDTGI